MQKQQHNNSPKDQQRHPFPLWVRWFLVILGILLIPGITVLWIIQGFQAIIPVAILTGLGVLLSFFQMLPSLFPTNRPEYSLPSPSQPTHDSKGIPLVPPHVQPPPVSTSMNAPAIPVVLPNPAHTPIEQGTQSTAGKPHVEWGEAPLIDQFYGREKELTELEQWIANDHCRVIAVLGIGGMGKTALAAKLVEQIKDQFEYVFWSSLQNAPPLESLLKTCLPFFSNQQRIDLPDERDRQVALLLHCLRDHRCLLILDNVETILQCDRAGQYLAEYEGYGHLIRCLGEAHHQSCLLLTSREKPKEVAQFEGKCSPIRSLQLLGLGLSEGQKILEDKGLFVSGEAQAALSRFYSGNPLALKLVSEPIREVFGGEVTTFLNQQAAVIGDIHDLIDQQFCRLPALEQEVMSWLAIEREPVRLADLQEDSLHPMAKGVLLEGLNSLRRRSLIEDSGMARFTLQPVVMEYVTARFIERVSKEIEAESIELFGSHLLIKAQAKDYVRDSQMRLILTPVEQSLLTILGREAMEKKLKSILSTLHSTHAQKLTYAAGNMLNLLTHVGYDLRGYDFSHLTVHQAYLQGATLHETTFAYADLATSVFTDTFGNVLSIAFSPDGRTFATGSEDQLVRLWDVTTGQCFKTLQGHTNWVYSVAFSPDGSMLASSGDDQTVRLWDTRTGQCLKMLQGHADWVWSVAFSPDGSILAGGGEDQTVRLWNVTTGQCFKTLQGHSNWVYSVAFSPDGTTLASSSEDQTVRLWDINTGQCLKTLQEHTNRVYSVTFSPNGTTLASSSEDQTIRLWDINTGQCLKTLQERVYPIAFSPDGTTLASGADNGMIHVWEARTGERLKTLQGHTNWVRSVAFSPDGTTLASSSDDQTVRIWNVTAGQCFKTLQGYTNRVYSIAFNHDWSTLVSGGDNGTVHVWNVNTGQCLKVLQKHSSRVRSIAFSPDGSTFASSSEDQTIRLWDATTGQCLKTLQEHTHWIWSLAFSPDGTILAGGSEDQTIGLWNVTTGQCFKTLQGHTNRARSIAFSPDGSTLLSGAEDKTVRLWDVNTGQCLQILQGHSDWVYAAAFSPDGGTLLSGAEDKTVRLWDVNTGQCLQILQGQSNWIYAVAFSPDGKILANSSTEGALELWDRETGQLLKFLQGHSNRVYSVIFSPDGMTLASGSNDGTIKFWNVQTGECLKTLRSERPYERMNITGVTGLTETQKTTLKVLGAIENEH